MSQSKLTTKFGSEFTDHMLKIEYDESRGGWQSPEITKFETIQLHPAAKVLQYATANFEGLKAFRGIDGKIRLFRPLLNFERFNRSAERACLPKIDTDSLLRFIKLLILADQEFIPDSTDGSLYIRPTLIGIDPDLRVCASSNALLYVILSPCGSYFGGGFRAVRLYADPTYVRAWTGGCGDCKMAANYGPTMFAQAKAVEAKCDQVLWLYGKEEQVTEVGTMTLFLFYVNDKGVRELLTPSLEDNLILPGITRRSVLEISREWNEFEVSERRITMSELIRLNEENRILEFFGTGTACVVMPVSEIYYRGNIIKLPTTNQSDPLYARYFRALTDIQYGRIEHPWAVEVTADEEDTKTNSSCELP